MTAINNNIVSKEKFKTPDFSNRVKSMLKLDFYRLFHTPLFYIMLAIAAIIPAMVLGLSVAETGTPQSNFQSSQYAANTPQAEMPAFDYTWQLIEASENYSPVEDGNSAFDMAGFANINMLYIFAGLLMAIFVAHDYSSGYVKNIFTVHSKKIDYVISKSAIGILSGAGMILTYVFGTVLAGALTGKSFELGVSGAGGLIFCLISKMLLMGVFCSLFLSIAVFFRNKLWVTIVFTFLFGMMFYPVASFGTTLDSTIIAPLVSLTAGIAGAFAFGAVSNLFLKKRDLA
ncbi:MAG: ABC transporter permease [Oscillospiraceae bacterium]|nr:ABC transporter permease [Oscillospiraceae bacterium]